MLSIENLSVSGRRVFLRVDFNVPRVKGSDALLDDTRIRETLPTIRYLLSQKARVILASHLGRPKGRSPEDSLEKIAEKLAELLGQDVIFPEDCIGDSVKKLAHDLRDGEIMLLENLRFYPEEETNDPDFSKKLAQLAEVYVTDAFGVLHRSHASTVGMVRHFKERGIGFLVKKELEFLEPLLTKPAKPFYAILGGAKVSDKIGLIEHLLHRVDGLLLGGGLACTFLKAQGLPMGLSKVEEDRLYVAQRIFQKAQEGNIPIYLPVDHRVADEFSPNAKARVVTQPAASDRVLDIGPETVRKYADILKRARTIFWNGPMGVFEFPEFASGSLDIAKAVAASGAVSVVGGGESVAAVKQSGVSDQITHLSTGGGATLEFLEGKTLPGLKVLEG